MMIDAAEPFQNELPMDAMQAAGISDMRAWCVGERPSIWSTMFSAAVLPMIPEAIPVRGTVAWIATPLGDFFALESGCGGAKAMPAA